MPDFHQNGVIATLHNFNTKKIEQIEKDLLSFSKTSPMTLILPSLYSELEKPALDQITIKNEFNFVARKLDISTDELNNYFNLPKKFYWDYPNQYQILNFGAKFLNLFGSEISIKR